MLSRIIVLSQMEKDLDRVSFFYTIVKYIVIMKDKSNLVHPPIVRTQTTTLPSFISSERSRVLYIILQLRI